MNEWMKRLFLFSLNYYSEKLTWMIKQWVITGYHLSDNNVIFKSENVPTYNDVVSGIYVKISIGQQCYHLIIVYGD